MSKNKEGYCHICGEYGPLSFEHIPPEKCFNNTKVETIKIFGNKKIISQKGAGGYTLCESCNNNTGTYYGRNYKEFIDKSAEIYRKINPSDQSLVKFQTEIYPLRVFKQIIAIFCSYCPEKYFYRKYPLIKRFLLSKEEQGFPDDLRLGAFFPYFEDAVLLRQSGIESMMYTNSQSEIKTCDFSEFIYPPLGFVLTTNNHFHPDTMDITFFKEFGYDEKRGINLKVPILPVVSLMPCDYRSKQEIYAMNEIHNKNGKINAPTCIPMKQFKDWREQ
ncbi:MAG TPA: hypothetical protein PLW78_03555 [bacterium]|nr:hypothetical protein [bacterium]